MTVFREHASLKAAPKARTDQIEHAKNPNEESSLVMSGQIDRCVMSPVMCHHASSMNSPCSKEQEPSDPITVTLHESSSGTSTVSDSA